MNFNTRCTIGRSWPLSAHRGAGTRNGPAGVLPQRKKNGAMKTASTRKRRPSAPPRRSGARSRPTRERILDAAERLFAQRGFHGVSIRDITGAADVDVALANYHFGSKQGLLEAVFLRRAEDLNSERLARLDAAIAGARDQPPQLEAIIDAFTHPLLDRSARGSPGWKSYFALIAEINNSPEFGGVLMTKTFDPVVQRFIEAIRRGISKVNIDTDMRIAFAAYVRKALAEKPEEIDPRKYLSPGRDAIREVVKEKIRLFQSEGKAK